MGGDTEIGWGVGVEVEGDEEARIGVVGEVGEAGF